MAAVSGDEGGHHAGRPRLCQSERGGPRGWGRRRSGRETEPMPLFDKNGKRLNAVHLARRLTPNQNLEWGVWVHTNDGKKIRGRLIVVRRSRQATEYARKKLRQEASKKQKSVSAEALEAAEYFFLWTTLPKSWMRKTILQLYRCRWQIELAFKRMKSIMGLGHLPRKDPESCRAWLHGKLFTSLLVERMIGAAKKFSPWGYELDASPEQVAGNGVHVS